MRSARSNAGSPSGFAPKVALAIGAFALVGYLLAEVSGAAGDLVPAILLAVTLAAAVLACALAGRGQSEARMAWRLLALATAAYGVSSISYTLVPNAAEAFPSAYDLGIVLFYPLTFTAFVVLVRIQVTGFPRLSWLDCALGAMVFAALGAACLWPLLDGATDLTVMGQFTYFLGDLGFLGFLLATYFLAGPRGGSSMLFFLLGSASLTVADGIWAVRVADGAPVPGLLTSLLWPVGIMLFAAGAQGKVREISKSPASWTAIAIPGVSALACLPILLLSDPRSPQTALAALALGLAVVRLMIGLRDNARLLERIREVATSDPLTGLPNRQLLLDRLEQALARRSRHGGLTGVLFIDLDEFKALNDAYGHNIGDEILIAVGKRLHQALRNEDTIARGTATLERSRPRDIVGRLGGDEFVVLLEDLKESADGVVVAERLLAELRAPLVVGAYDLSLDASIGITFAGNAADRTPSEILRDADVALYAAKRAGKGRCELFESEMRERIVSHAALIRDLRRAVEDDQLRLVYQPQVDLLSGRITGVEALVRWQHPDRGLIPPNEFISVAESTGMIVAIDDWVLREACNQLRAWDDAALEPLHLAVNVSARRVGTDDLAQSIETVLRETGVPAQRLELELTETMAIEHDAQVVATITKLRDLGVQVAIDDFGMGHSALSRLHNFPVDRLKIDRSFVGSLVHGAERGSIADAMIAIGQSLGLEVVAEGVETEEHLQALRSLGCPTAQGYLFSKPVPAWEIEALTHAGCVFPTPGADDAAAISRPEQSTVERERLARNLLAEIQRLTGLETTYLTRIDWDQAVQQITHSRNAGTMDIQEGLTIEWSDTVCRRALEQGVNYTDNVPATFPDSQAGEDLGLQTYLSVPLVNGAGEIEGTICGASTKRVPLGPEAMQVMERCARILSQGIAGQPGSKAESREPANRV